MKFREYLLNEAVNVNDPPLVKQIKKICQTIGIQPTMPNSGRTKPSNGDFSPARYFHYNVEDYSYNGLSRKEMSLSVNYMVEWWDNVQNGYSLYVEIKDSKGRGRTSVVAVMEDELDKPIKVATNFVLPDDQKGEYNDVIKGMKEIAALLKKHTYRDLLPV